YRIYLDCEDIRLANIRTHAIERRAGSVSPARLLPSTRTLLRMAATGDRPDHFDFVLACAVDPVVLVDGRVAVRNDAFELVADLVGLARRARNLDRPELVGPRVVVHAGFANHSRVRLVQRER